MNYQDQQGLNDFIQWLDYQDKEPSKKVSDQKAVQEFISVKEEEPTYSTPQSYTAVSQADTPSTLGYNYSLTDLENDPEFASIAGRFLESLGESEDIFEYLRDEDFSLSAAAVRASQIGEWSEQQKQDYVYLRSKFDNADLRGFRERFNLVKDLGIDIIADPVNYLTLLFAAPTLGASFGGRAAGGALAKTGLKQLIKSQVGQQATKGALFGAAEGAMWAGPHEYFLQDIDINLGLREEIDLSLIAETASLGAAFGGVLGGALGGLHGAKFANKEFKFMNEQAIEETAEAGTRQQVIEDSIIDDSLLSKRPDGLYKFISLTTGKPTTEFLNAAKKSETLQELLGKFRYDWDISMTGRRTEAVREKSYGLAVGETQGKYLYGLQKALNVLYRTGFKAKIDLKQNNQLIALLRDDTLYKKGMYQGEKIDNQVLSAYTQIRDLLQEAKKEGTEVGLFAPYQFVRNYFPRRFSYEALENNREQFKKLLKDSGHADPLNEKTTIELVLEDGTKVRGTRAGDLGVDVDTFGIDFLEEAKKRLPEGSTEAQIKELAKELKSEKIVSDMLEYRWTPFELRSRNQTGASTGFLQTRRFSNIKDEDLAEFLDNDVQSVLEDYFTNFAQGVNRTKFFGKSIADYENTYIAPIIEELVEGGATRAQAEEVAVGLRKMHRRVTGIETDAQSYLKKNKIARTFSDFGKLSQQMAHLPFATLSSITEPLILLSRVGIADAPAVVADIGKSLVKEGRSIIDRTIKGFRRGVLRQKVAGIKDIDDEAWGELYKTGLALEQAVQERIEGLAGEGLTNNTLKTIQQGFFKANLLTQWTKAVQLASFTTGKRLITTNARKLAEGKLTASNKQYLTRQLRDLGIDENEAVAWYKNSINAEGKFDIGLAKQQNFYEGQLTSGANRFTKEIILNPSTAEANRPLWFSTPAAQMLVQFAGYPTVFNNTVLKRFANETINSPFQATPKVLGTVMLMTAVAHIGNIVRSNGNNLYDYETGDEKEAGQLIGEAMRRWGGYGPFDYVNRFNETSQRNNGEITSLLKSIAGPLPQDVIDAVLYRKGLLEVGVTNLPFYQSYDLVGNLFEEPDVQKRMRAWARGSKPEKAGGLKGLSTYAKGGIVDVPQAIDEPDERINPYTGEPYNAGIEFLQDEEEKGLEGQMKGLGLK